MDLTTKSNNLPVSFQSSPTDRSAFQTSIILAVLNRAIKTSTPVSKNDIISAYKTAKFKGKPYLVVCTKWDKNAQRWIYEKQSINEYSVWYNDALQWFKSNLGAAIIKGKVLAIPVIEI